MAWGVASMDEVQMRRFSVIIIICVLLALAAASTDGAVYNVKDYGATGNGSTSDTAAINAAVAACDPNGVVYFPSGTFKSGSIILKSDITLELSAGATLLATSAPEYSPVEDNPWDEYQDWGHSHWESSLIWATGVNNVTITGTGLIDGTAMTCGDPADYYGDRVISFKLCTGILIEDIRIYNGGHFCIITMGCSDVIIDNVLMDTNRDGINIDCSDDVEIVNCTVNSPWDDAICIKSSYGLGYKRATENVLIDNCTVMGYSAGHLLYPPGDGDEGWHAGRIKFGTESNGGFKNITITNCYFDYCRGFMLATVDGGDIDNIVISNIQMTNLFCAPIFMRLGDRARGPGPPPPGTYRNVTFTDITAGFNTYFDGNISSIMSGIPGHYIEDITLTNVQVDYPGGGTAADAQLVLPENETGGPDVFMFGMKTPSYGFYLRHVDGVTFNNCRFDVESPDARPKYKLIDALNTNASNFFASIDLPVENSVVFHGEPITFSASAGGGTEPYTYQWQSDVDGNLGTGAELVISDLSVNRSGGQLLPHIITLTAQDAAGHSYISQIELTVKFKGDANSDGDVDLEDVNIIATDWLVRDYIAPATFANGLYHIPRAAAAPIRDGVIGSAEWDGALVVEMNNVPPLLGGGYSIGSEAIHTTWRLMWDANYLHVAGRMYDTSHDFRKASPGPYNTQDVIQICFNPNNDIGHTFVEGSGVAAIYDLVAQTSNSYGPDVYRHGKPNNTVPAALSSGSVHSNGWTYEGSIPWSELMVGENTGYVPSAMDEHGLGLIIISWKSSSYTLITNFGNGSETIGQPATWNKMILVDDFSNCVLGYYNHDLNQDCTINFKDLAVLALEWLE
jgi:polygalacturonase